jgi:FAD/FMN-containing dehydrogenase
MSAVLQQLACCVDNVEDDFVNDSAAIEQLSSSPYSYHDVNRKLPLAVLLPRNEQQIVKILDVCRQHKLNVISIGAGTNLEGPLL